MTVALSSAEAELVAMNKTASEVLGILSMLFDLGEDQKTRVPSDSVGANPSGSTGNLGQESLTGFVCGDSSAAIAISQRRGCGKLRHIHIGQL